MAAPMAFIDHGAVNPGPNSYAIVSHLYLKARGRWLNPQF
jgi:hypothetical protein